jgi:ABC-type multidrug transport system ATPase subunit
MPEKIQSEYEHTASEKDSPFEGEVRFNNATISIDGKAILKTLTGHCPANRLTIVTGKVGCGRSTLLSSILGELDIVSGSISTPSGLPIPFSAQEPFLRAQSTVRQNITFGLPFEEGIYTRTTEACGLRHMLLEHQQRDSRKAQGLSGGERSRIGLARAVYCSVSLARTGPTPLSVVLLDDPLSALDPLTEEHVFNALFGEEGLLRDKTVILTSNDSKRFIQADHLIYLQNSTIVAEGSFENLMEKSPGFETFVSEGCQRSANTATIPVVDDSTFQDITENECEDEVVQQEAKIALLKKPIKAAFDCIRAAGLLFVGVACISGIAEASISTFGVGMSVRFWHASSAFLSSPFDRSWLDSASRKEGTLDRHIPRHQFGLPCCGLDFLGTRIGSFSRQSCQEVTLSRNSWLL